MPTQRQKFLPRRKNKNFMTEATAKDTQWDFNSADVSVTQKTRALTYVSFGTSTTPFVRLDKEEGH